MSATTAATFSIRSTGSVGPKVCPLQRSKPFGVRLTCQSSLLSFSGLKAAASSVSCESKSSFLGKERRIEMGNRSACMYFSYQEAWEMSYFGANVLHPRTIIPVMRYDIPIVIRNIFNLSAPGTKICRTSATEIEEGQRREGLVKGFATIDNLALVNVEGTGMAGIPATASAIFAAVKDVGANVIMISQASSEHSICFAVLEKEVKAVAEALQSRFRQALDAGRLSQVAIIPNCSILASVGQKMASTPGVSASLFNALAKANINIRAIAQGCSEYNITVVLKREDCIKALRAVHSRFYLSRTTIAMGIVGPGLIGATLLDQLRDQMAGKLVNIKLHTRRSQRVVKESRSLCTCECRRSNSTAASLFP